MDKNEVNSAFEILLEEIRRKFNLARRTVQRDLSKLVDLGLIKEIAKSKTDPTRYYELL